MCFIWALLSAIHPPSNHPQELYHYKQYRNDFKITNLGFPLSLRDIPKFLKLNPNLSVNVFGIDDDDDRNNEIIPLHITRNKKDTHVNMLLFSNDDGDNWHYVWVKNMSSLVAHRSKHEHKIFVCDNCVRPYKTKKSYELHLENCLKHQPMTVRLPSVITPDDKSSKTIKPTLKFKSKQKCHPVPFIMIGDFEAFLTPVQNVSTDTNSTVIIDRHIPSGFAAKTICYDDDSLSSDLVCYSGENVIDEFFAHIMREKDRINDLI